MSDKKYWFMSLHVDRYGAKPYFRNIVVDIHPFEWMEQNRDNKDEDAASYCLVSFQSITEEEAKKWFN